MLQDTDTRQGKTADILTEYQQQQQHRVQHWLCCCLTETAVSTGLLGAKKKAVNLKALHENTTIYSTIIVQGKATALRGYFYTLYKTTLLYPYYSQTV